MDTYKARDLMRQIAEATHICGDPGHAVRHHRQRLAHLPEHGAHQRQQPVLGVHVPGRLGVQPGVDQPDEVRVRRTIEERRRVRSPRRSTPRAATLITAQEILVDNSSYPTQAIEQEQPRLPSARPRLRQPRRAADVARPALRQRRRPRLLGGDHRGHARRGVRAVGEDRPRPRRAVRRLREEPRAVPARHAQAPRGAQGHRPHATCRRTSSRRPRRCGTRSSSWASSTATATRRPPCSRRPAPSAS